MGKAKGPRQKSIPKLNDLGDLLERFQKSMDNLDKLDDLEKLQTEPVELSKREFQIDVDKIESLDDVKEVIRAMEMTIFWSTDNCPEKFKTIYNKGLLKEIKNESI